MTAVHLDLKGLQFKHSYLPAFLRDLASQRVNTLFVEYEDVFPFEGMDIAADRDMRWSPAQVRKLNTLAKENGIDIVPIQQCLGHLEYMLAWKSYRKLALNPAYPSTLNIDKPKARQLIQNMLAQVIEAHPDSQYIHLGMDEAHALVEHHGPEKVVEVFLDYLEVLLDQVQAAGKTAIIWSDMLENNLLRVGKKLESFKDRVIMASWDYSADGTPVAAARLAGMHIRKKWIEHPELTDGPKVGMGTTFVEDQPAAVRDMLKAHQQSDRFAPLYLADMWAKMGFRVIGCSAIRASEDRSVLPLYNHRNKNIQAWSKRVKDSGLMGNMATSWARGNSFIPPNYCIDAAWPLVGQLSRTMGKRPLPFFEGIDQATVDRIVAGLGRCRVDWSIELKIADEMDALSRKVKSHRYEWDGMALLARALNVQRRAKESLAEVEYFAPNHRPVDSEWQRRINDQKEVLGMLVAMRQKVRKHFSKRWHGKAFEEWVGQIFDVDEAHLKRIGAECRKKLSASKKHYQSR